MFPNGAVVPEKIRLLEAAVKASEINIQKHGDSADFSGLAEFEEVVFEVLVAFHGASPPKSPPKMQKIACFWHGDTLSTIELYRVITTGFL